MSKVIAVVTLYRPDAFVLPRIIELSEQVDHVIAVDDGSPADYYEMLDKIEQNGFQVIRLSSNSGIAKALNAGIEIALSSGATFILTIDQDTTLEKSYVAKCLEVFRSSSKATSIGVVATDSVNSQPSIPGKYSPEGFGLVGEHIQSGMLISKECIESAGGMDERLFIDCVDTEFCARVLDSNFSIAIAPGSNILHSLGRREAYRPFGLRQFDEYGEEVTYQYHPPFRQYYIVRNNIDLCFRYFRKNPRWVASIIRREFKPRILPLYAGPSRLASFLAVCLGTAHGVMRRRGKIPTWLFKTIS